MKHRLTITISNHAPRQFRESLNGRDLPLLFWMSLLYWISLELPCFFERFFPSFPGILGVRHREKILVFLGGFPFPKMQGKEDQGGGLSNGGLRPLSAICAQSSTTVHFCGLFGPLSMGNYCRKMTTIVGSCGHLCGQAP